MENEKIIKNEEDILKAVQTNDWLHFTKAKKILKI
jgi:hypothetical protein